MSVKPIPDGYHTVTPHLVLRDAAKAIDFYKKAFGAEELFRMPGPDGKIMHAEIKIGDSIVYLCDELPRMKGWVSPAQLKGTTVCLHIYTEDVDAAFDKAVAAGATVTMPIMDAFWGDRYGKLSDPFGHEWSIATHKHDYTPEQIAKNAQEFFANMPSGDT
jgi:uncharacterized glyoxalase superfamily protein PhnB